MSRGRFIFSSALLFSFSLQSSSTVMSQWPSGGVGKEDIHSIDWPGLLPALWAQEPLNLLRSLNHKHLANNLAKIVGPYNVPDLISNARDTSADKGEHAPLLIEFTFRCRHQITKQIST